MKITNEILEAYLNCKTKGHLKLNGESDTKSDYEVMTEEASRASRELSLARLVARYGRVKELLGQFLPSWHAMCYANVSWKLQRSLQRFGPSFSCCSR